MTDTVNVPQEMIDAVMTVAVGVDEFGSAVFPGQVVAAEIVRVALAAAPKAEPVARSAEYRPEREDYLNPAIGRQYEAPKVEQEPVMVPEVFWSWLVERGLAPDAPDFDWRDIVETLNEHEDNLIDPAPASDELLEALIEAVEATRFMDEPFIDDDSEWFRKHDQWAAARKKALAFIAKHKGPQS